MKMGIVTFTVGSNIYKFKEHLMLETKNVEGGICLIHKGLSLAACGKSFSECEGIIRDQLAVIWMTYTITPDNRLTPDAIVFKKKLLSMVEEVK